MKLVIRFFKIGLRVFLLGLMTVSLTACPVLPPNWVWLVQTKTSEVITTVGGKAVSPQLQPVISGLDEVYSWNRFTERTLSTGSGNQLPTDAEIDLAWYPPQGSGGFWFKPPMPENPNGPPPFRWKKLPPDTEVKFTYTTPGFDDEDHQVDEYLEARVGDEIVSAAKFSYLVHEYVPKSNPNPILSRKLIGNTADALQSTEAIPWNIVVDAKPSVTLNQFSCEYLQSSEAYFALRLPAVSSTFTNSVQLPVFIQTGLSSEMQIYQIISNTNQSVLTNTLVIRPGSMGEVEQTLPTAPGEHWVSLGAAVVKDCPIDLDSDDWGISLSMAVDGSVPAGHYPMYLCFDGEASPSGGAATPLCSGPYDLTIRDVINNPPPFSLKMFSNSTSQPLGSVQFPHRLNGGPSGGQAITVTLTNTTTLMDTTWGMYYDTEDSFWQPTAPDMSRLILPGDAVEVWGGPFNTFIWLVQLSPTASDTPPGQYTVSITAMQGAVAEGQTPWMETAHDIIWVEPGDVTIPPPPACSPVSELTLQATSNDRNQLGHTFEITASVSPPTATLPVSYTYTISGLDPMISPFGAHTNMQALTLATPGTYTVTVQAQACAQENPITHSIQVISLGQFNGLWLPLVQR